MGIYLPDGQLEVKVHVKNGLEMVRQNIIGIMDS